MLKCANCNQTGHPASYKGCPFIKFAIQKKKELKNAAKQPIIERINKISSHIREATSYAQATSSRLHQSQLQPQMINRNPLTTIPRTFTEATLNREAQTTSNNQPSAQIPSWVSDFKKEIKLLVTSQFQTLATQIANNTERIEFIFNTFFSD